MSNFAPLRVAVFVSGRGSNLLALLRAKARGELPAVAFSVVFSDVERPAAFDFADQHGIPTASLVPKSYETKMEYESEVVRVLREHAVDFIVLAGYMRIVGPTLLHAFPNRIINIHPALLPAFPGLHAQRQAIAAGVTRSGCTVHFVDAGMDTGPIILQREVACPPDDTEAALSARILEEEHRALPEALDLISRGLVQVENGKVEIRRRDE